MMRFMPHITHHPQPTPVSSRFPDMSKKQVLSPECYLDRPTMGGKDKRLSHLRELASFRKLILTRIQRCKLAKKCLMRTELITSPATRTN